MHFINAREALAQVLAQQPELNELEIIVNSRALKGEEAIGSPDRDDFPLLRGKEVLLQAEVPGGVGQAFTADPVAYHGRISSLLELSDDRPGNHALLVASLNALLKRHGQVEHTIHCINNEPEMCADYISRFVLEKHGPCKIGIVGYQPAILEHCVRVFGTSNVRITDLSADVVGTNRFGIDIMDGFSDTGKLAAFADVLLLTGTILANNTYSEVLGEVGEKPCYFFGTTCAALSYLNNQHRLCPFSK